MTDFEDDSVLRIVRSLGPISLSTFDDRLRLQKLAYLAQELGAGNKYFYSWYVRGPYSSPLASALFLGDEQDKFSSKPSLTKNESRIISLLRSLMGKEITKPLKLELFASIWYLLPSRRLSKEDQEAVLDIMCKEKPHFKRSEVKTALKAILDFKKSL